MNEHAYFLEAERAPVLTVSPNQIVKIPIVNAFGREFQSPADFYMYKKSQQKHHPLFGPIFIEGCKAGSTVRVAIHKIQPHKNSYNANSLSTGVLKGHEYERRFDILSTLQPQLDGYNLKTRPSLGVIGAATCERTRSGRCGKTGGNLDINLLVEGAEVFLPVEFDGGLVYVGDAHLYQGAGEINGIALETSASISISFSTSNISIDFPIIKKENQLAIVGYGTDVNLAIQSSVLNSIQLLRLSNPSLSFSAAYQIVGVMGEICLGHITGAVCTAATVIPTRFIKGDDGDFFIC
ncbi:acetamidase/formamidase family protein [Pelosinus fermentans]|nr:acetamidase/formamidase family protein [Pelosinus fermentans]